MLWIKESNLEQEKKNIGRIYYKRNDFKIKDEKAKQMQKLQILLNIYFYFYFSTYFYFYVLIIYDEKKYASV